MYKRQYLDHTEDEFSITNKYELPILSGMKITVQKEENGFLLKDIVVDQEKIDKEKEYSILLTDVTRSILEKTTPGCRIKQLPDMTLSSAWTAFMEKGQQPLAPEDYIEVKKKSADGTSSSEKKKSNRSVPDRASPSFKHSLYKASYEQDEQLYREKRKNEYGSCCGTNAADL